MTQEVNIDKDFFLGNAKLLEDAEIFLAEREEKEFNSDEEVYDAFMEHFRYQNVNEVTAMRDLYYANNQTDDEGRERLGRLMDTYDNMDSDFGLTAAQDYLGGVFTAPSTYAGMFSFGAAKAGSLAAQQGIKLGIREVVKDAAKRAGKKLTKKQLDDVTFDTARKRVARKAAGEKTADVSIAQRAKNLGQGVKAGGYKAGIGASVSEMTGAGATVTAQELTRVNTMADRDEVDLANIGLITGLSGLTGGVFGTLTGAQKTIRSNVAEQFVIKELGKQKKQITQAYKNKTLPVFNSKTYGAAAREKEKSIKLSLEETQAMALAEGEQVKKKLTGTRKKAFDRYQNLTTGLQDMEVKNIAAAAIGVIKSIPSRVKEDGTKVIKNSKEDMEERITSRIARGLKGGLISTDGMVKIMRDHGVTLDQFSSFYVADISEAARKLGTQGRLSRAETRAIKEELTSIDQSLMEMGSSTAAAYTKSKQLTEGRFGLTVVSDFITALNKTRIGFMTIQTATTVRNTTNGLMRNYDYALQNIGAGAYNVVKGSATKGKLAFSNATDKELKAAADLSVRQGVAQLKAGGASALLDDMLFGMQSQETAIIVKMMRDKRLKHSNQAHELFRELGDIANISGVENTPMLRSARFFNTFNTMSDNMFKSAIFSREINKMIKTDADNVFKKAGINGLDDLLKKEKFGYVGDKAISKAMDEALEFTYQSGRFRGKEGYANKTFDWFIDGASSVLGSTLAPFPRYLVNQFRFVYEHTPVLGMINLGGILNKTGKGKEAVQEISERFGKQVSGLTTLGAFYALRQSYGDESTAFYEYLDPTSGGKINAKAALGPFMFPAYVSDTIYRLGAPNGKLTKLLGYSLHDNDKVRYEFKGREFAESLVGSQFRAKTGLDIIDGVIKIATDNVADAKTLDIAEMQIAKYLANIFSTVTVGMGTIKDIYAQFDPAYVNVPLNEDIEFWPYFFKQATRTMPIAVTDSDPMLWSPLLERDAVQSTTKSIPIRNVNPILKQITGLSFEERQNAAEKELDRLQFDWIEVAPKRTLDAKLDNKAKKILGDHIERVLSAKVTSPDYIHGQNTDTKKIQELTTLVQAMKSKAVSVASQYSKSDTFVDPESERADILRKNRVQFYKEIPTRIRQIMIEDYDAEGGHPSFSETQDFTTLLERYHMTNGYKEELSKKSILERYMGTLGK